MYQTWTISDNWTYAPKGELPIRIPGVKNDLLGGSVPKYNRLPGLLETPVDGNYQTQLNTYKKCTKGEMQI